MANKKSELVVKSNRLIEASYRLSMIEQQVVLLAISRARDEQKGLFADLPITIRVDEFVANYAPNSDATNVYRQLKEAMATLFDRHVVLHDIDPATQLPRVTKTRWISQASYVDGAGHIQFIFAPAVIPFITRLGETGEFTRYKIEKIGQMTSIYAVRLYELLFQYASIGKRDLSVAWLREAFQLEGKYKLLADFKKYVIDVAVAQINEFSDIDVSYKQIKTGRTVTGFDFKIRLLESDNPKKKATIDKEFVRKNARTGESWDEAYRRLLEERGQQRLA